MRELFKNPVLGEQNWQLWAQDWQQIELHKPYLVPDHMIWLENEVGARYSDWMYPENHLLLIRDKHMAVQFVLEGRDLD